MFQLTPIEEQAHPELSEIIARIKAGRRGNLIYLYKLLLLSPPIAAAWFEHLSAVRFSSEIDGRIRELVILRVAILMQERQVRKEHESFFAPKEGITPDQIAALENWTACSLFNETERAVLAYTDAMTRGGAIAADVQNELQRHFSERQIVELTVCIGTYNMLVRVFQGLNIADRVDAEENHRSN